MVQTLAVIGWLNFDKPSKTDRHIFARDYAGTRVKTNLCQKSHKHIFEPLLTYGIVQMVAVWQLFIFSNNMFWLFKLRRQMLLCRNRYYGNAGVQLLVMPPKSVSTWLPGHNSASPRRRVDTTKLTKRPSPEPRPKLYPDNTDVCTKNAGHPTDTEQYPSNTLGTVWSRL